MAERDPEALAEALRRLAREALRAARALNELAGTLRQVEGVPADTYTACGQPFGPGRGEAIWRVYGTHTTPN